MVALHKIQLHCKSMKLLIPKAPLSCAVREVLQRVGGGLGTMIQSIALAVIQEASEAFTVGLMKDANFCAIHGKLVGRK